MAKRILTFNHHESYLCSLADTGYRFDVVTRVGHLDLGWNVRSRDVPSNFELIDFEAARGRLRSGEYELVICHTVKNLAWLFWYFNVPFIFVAHIPLFFYRPDLALKSLVKKFFWKVFRLTHKASFLAVSEFKRRMWSEQGDVVILSPKDFGSLDSEQGYQSVALVCNDLASRRDELGYEDVRQLQKEFGVSIIGDNPGVDGAIKPRDFEEFSSLFRRHRIYLYTIRAPFGDGYNTAMLEAMRLGMAIVTVNNPSSPIVHGKNGLVARDAEELRQHLRFLLGNRAEVDRLGEAARETIAERFNEESFIEGWRLAIQRSLGQA